MRVDPKLFRLLALLTLICYSLLVLTGGAVRLTGSGLGCADWPTCTAHSLVAPLSFHPMMEFGNRLVTVAASVISVATFLAALARRPFRRDLVWLAGGIIAGLAAQVILGGLVVLTKLNPYLVGLHFLLTIVMIANALYLYHRCETPATKAEPVVGKELVWLARLIIVVLGFVLMAGTATSGAGPHTGSLQAKRIDYSFRALAELHADFALLLIGITLATLFAVHQAHAPFQVQKRAWTMMELMAIQGALGYTQYFLHDSALVIEFHLAGATLVSIAVLSFYISLHHHLPSLTSDVQERPPMPPSLQVQKESQKERSLEPLS